MSNKILIILIIISILTNNKVIASTAICNYNFFYSSFTCDLKLQNPNDESDLTQIGGDHIIGKSDSGISGVTVHQEVRVANLFPVVCEKFVNLKHFHIHKIVLSDIRENSFVNCKKLSELTLKSSDYSSQFVTSLPEGLLTENKYLIKLSIELKHLATLPEKFFANQENLLKLNLLDNKIKTLPANIFKPLVNLQHLVLSGNEITEINPEWFSTLINLDKLFLSHNKITDLPKNAFTSLKKVEEIWLDYNQITAIHSDSFGQLPYLEVVKLWFNKIETVDEKFIDDIPVRTFPFANNVCADQVYSSSKSDMKNALKRCFQNYSPRAENQYTGSSAISFSSSSIAFPDWRLENKDDFLRILNEMQTEIKILKEDVRDLKTQNEKILKLVVNC